MATLTAKQRHRLPPSDFVFPKREAYPIPDKAHAAAARSRVETYGTPEEKAKVYAATKRKFPELQSLKAKVMAEQRRAR